MRLTLAIDQSTSATKALLFTDDGQVLDREAREHQQLYPCPGWVEHDAEEIWLCTLKATTALLTRHADKLDALVALSLTNQRETIVVFDPANGQPLAPAMVWQCRRGVAVCDTLRTSGHEPLVHRKTGLKLDAYFSASKLAWLAQERSDLHRRLTAGTALIGTIDTYLIYRLTHCAVFATDFTNASRTLLFDIGALRWDEELCALFRVPARALAEVRESSATFGDTTLDGFLARPLSIRGVMGDSQASLFAQHCSEPGSAKVTLGTGSSVLLNIGSTLRLSTRGVVTALAWVHRGVPTYAFEGIIISSAATLTWLRDQLRLVNDIAELETLARDTDSNGGVYLVPAFTGLGFPHWQPDARAALVGLSSHSDRRHVARAAFESIAFQIRDALEVMRADAGIALGEIHADGGPTANEFLMQLTADLTGTTLRVATMPDCSALGAVLAGNLSPNHEIASARLADVSRDDLIYRPSLALESTTQFVQGWHAAIRQVLSP